MTDAVKHPHCEFHVSVELTKIKQARLWWRQQSTKACRQPSHAPSRDKRHRKHVVQALHWCTVNQVAMQTVAAGSAMFLGCAWQPYLHMPVRAP
ncbi:TPA: hypothetical protein HH295_19025 [Xanthomonas vasicola pv. zeae]|uniref:Uncharacterized protein n=1 Tax=Xanthomonas vasicola pv. vasculorum TaxID=325776 RepID=A0AAE8F8F7_XANVA|nr:hypothetical protein [Xanthomonas vasicola]AVQ05374.1 hypothetical protein C7V42_00550 [Xanthomonas vasicola pv. vasculorum]HHZ24821.1 hypothetical protein [Xanthomonas vasicola pv. zeae]AZM69572.1 hypothetical protein CXP37_00560 [Xanthomonas vasicola pv. vasculorum]AZR33224.1 hypothetical protein NX08_000505 [Xanthomonas vasicola]KEZ94970.1 hypothetical protein A11M_0123980 [Xanthomonas vasicola pv. vasculorum NCPPB 895]